MAMNTKLKERWIKALRSGKYAQSTEYLASEDVDGNKSYCCLGVLQCLNPKLERHPSDAELLDPASAGIPEKLQVKLAGYNDEGKSFAWIAAYIERRKSL